MKGTVHVSDRMPSPLANYHFYNPLSAQASCPPRAEAIEIKKAGCNMHIAIFDERLDLVATSQQYILAF